MLVDRPILMFSLQRSKWTLQTDVVSMLCAFLKEVRDLKFHNLCETAFREGSPDFLPGTETEWRPRDDFSTHISKST